MLPPGDSSVSVKCEMEYANQPLQAKEFLYWLRSEILTFKDFFYACEIKRRTSQNVLVLPCPMVKVNRKPKKKERLPFSAMDGPEDCLD